VIAQNSFGRAETNVAGSAAKFSGDRIEIFEEWLNETIKPLPGGREAEWAALKQRDAERIFELKNLRADGGLLDAVRNATNGFADAAGFGHVVVEFEVMDIHGALRRLAKTGGKLNG
jgi:hypothetical protein